MNGFEEIKRTTKNFIESSKQAKQEIGKIERKRNELAQERNEKKNADIGQYKAEISALGNQISQLGNQSQELQNKLDKRFREVQKVVNLMADNLIAEEIRKIRKIAEDREELEEKIKLQEERDARYELQKQDFYERFGRVPVLSANAKRQDEIQDKQNQVYRAKIEEIEKIIENKSSELAKYAELKRNFAKRNFAKIICDEEISKIEENNEEDAVLPLIEKIQEEEVEDITEFQQAQLIGEIELDDVEPVEEVQIQEIEPIKEVAIQEIEPLEEHHEEKQIQQVDEIEELAKSIVEQIVAEQEIISFEKEKIQEVNEIEEPSLLGIIAKIENGEIVYKVQISDGNELKIYPTKLASGNALLNDKAKREEIKEILINHAIAEYKPLDKKVIKKIDPIVCEALTQYAIQYNYDAENLIYNYAMSFSKNEARFAEVAPITYNFSYLEGINLRKTEKRAIAKICKNAIKNENIDVIGSPVTFSGIRYALRRLFASNEVKALPEKKGL